MPSYTLSGDSPSINLATDGYSQASSATFALARLLCDTTIGTDDLTSTNSQNNFVLDLIAAVGPVMAFNAICRQLLRIKNTVAYPYSGTAYSQISNSTYNNYLSTYLMTDVLHSTTITSGAQYTNFLPEQFQTLAAFANAGVPITQMLQVADYHIIMIYLTGTLTSVPTLIYTNMANPNSSTYSYSNYAVGDNIASAKYRYAISTLSQNGSVVFGKDVPQSHIVAGLLVDPVYTNITLADTAKIYGLLGSVATVTHSENSLRTTYTYLIKPVKYSLNASDLKKEANYTTSLFTFTVMNGYSQLTSNSMQYMWFYNSVSNGIGITPVLSVGTPFNPTQKQLVTVASLSTQTAPQIYTTLNFTTNSTATDEANATGEIKQFKDYLKTIAEIRALVDTTGTVIPLYNKPSLFYAAGFTNAQISTAFAGSNTSVNYDFAVLIGVCKYIVNPTDKTLLKAEPVSTGNGKYDFRFLHTDSIPPKDIVTSFKNILTVDVANTSMDIGNAAKLPNLLLTHVLSCYKDVFTTATALNAANAEAAVLRYLHNISALNSTTSVLVVADSSGILSYIDANPFAATTNSAVKNLYPFSKVENILSAKLSSTLGILDILSRTEFAAYSKAAGELQYGVITDGTNSSTFVAETTAAASGSQYSKQYFITNADLSGNNVMSIMNRTYYTLGFFAKNYYQTVSTKASYFDNGRKFKDVYDFIAPDSSVMEALSVCNWPRELPFTSELDGKTFFRDILNIIKTKMKPTAGIVSDEQMKKTTATLTGTSALWITLTDLLLGPIRSGNKYDNTSYKTLVSATVTDQYIKIDLAKNLPSTTTTSDFTGIGLPMDVALYVVRNLANTNTNVNIYTIVKDTNYSRYARRHVFDDVIQASRQLDAATFTSLVWTPAELKTVVQDGTLNISLVDLLTLAVPSSEVSSDWYVVGGNQSRYAYYTPESRQSLIKVFYPLLDSENVVAIGKLVDRDEILDKLTSLANDSTYFTDASGNKATAATGSRFVFTM
jgi:hypothetical protein